jgi:hypothetical protein
MPIKTAPRPQRPVNKSNPSSASQAGARPSSQARDSAKSKPPAKILFQNYFKSVGPRTYAAQIKEAGNGNHFLVLTEGKRNEANELRKLSLFVFSEDFPEFFRMLHETAQFIKSNPVSDDVKAKRARYWKRKDTEARDADSKPG